MFAVIDKRNGDIRWHGDKEDCKWYINAANPFNRKYYKIVKLEESEK